MTEITLNGVSITELKNTKALIQKDAVKFIANGINDATTLIKSILETAEGKVEVDKEDFDSIEAAAKHAVEILENVSIVSGVSGVTYKLPFSEDGYYDETPFTRALEDAGLHVYGHDAIADLFGTLEDMEANSRNWHSSRCW